MTRTVLTEKTYNEGLVENDGHFDYRECHFCGKNLFLQTVGSKDRRLIIGLVRYIESDSSLRISSSETSTYHVFNGRINVMVGNVGATFHSEKVVSDEEHSSVLSRMIMEMTYFRKFGLEKWLDFIS